MGTSKRKREERIEKQRKESQRSKLLEELSCSKKKKDFVRFKPKDVYRRPTKNYPSAIAERANTSKVENQKILTGEYMVGQAYNKGGYVVLSKSEAQDPSTGKRR